MKAKTAQRPVPGAGRAPPGQKPAPPADAEDPGTADEPGIDEDQRQVPGPIRMPPDSDIQGVNVVSIISSPDTS